ncbi:WD40/YVTN/BNR-like repeat-containing protein [Brevibacillus sp. B_LB10_24]|uniref:WD40/YVTN/BNR-like repeat-containing protein n=1 Tax=Brevibacillus sp. B_LB10_24 TaxID=3380645 RepID=UPI0038B847D9
MKMRSSHFSVMMILGMLIALVCVPFAAVPNVQAAPADELQLAGFQMMDEMDGYTWGTHGSTLVLYRTADNGKTWKNIALPTVKASANPVYGRDLFFYDKQNGWIVGSNGERGVILHTVNGGEKWTVLPAPGVGQIASMDFITPQTGVLLASDGNLYLTQDGGTTWKKGSGSFAGSENVKGMLFRDVQNGWILSPGDDKIPHLFRTRDGGQKWELLSLPELTQVCNSEILSAPVFFGSDKKKGWFPARCNKGDRKQYYVSFTEDGGEHWKVTPIYTKLAGQFVSAVPLVFADDQRGWYVQAQQVYQTTNRGVTWNSTLPDKGLIDAFNAYPNVVQMQFVSINTGWMLLKSLDGKKTQLLQSTDGAKSWHVASPVANK